MKRSEVFSTTIGDMDIANKLDQFASEHGMDRAKLVRHALEKLTGLNISGSIRHRKVAKESFGLPEISLAHIAANADLYPEAVKRRYGLRDRQLEAIRRKS